MKKRLLSAALVLTLCSMIAAPAGAYGGTGRAGQTNPVSVGGVNTGVVDADGSLWMWGWNEAGQVGNGGGGDSTYKSNGGDVYPFQSTPVQVLEGVVSVSCGMNHTAAIKTDGSLWMWGGNEVGQLGNNGVGNATYEETVGIFPKSTKTHCCQTTPQKVMEQVAAVSCGNGYTAVIRTDGSLWMWGSNENGQLGNGTTELSKSPLKIMDHVAVVSCGYTTTAVVKTDGSLWMWGEGYLGNGEYTQRSTLPVKIMEDAKDVSCGYDLAAAVKTDGTLWAWGNVSGNPYNAPSLSPVQKGSNAISVTCGRDFGAVITADGSTNLKMWGDDNYGQCGSNRSGSSGSVTFGGADTGIRIYYRPSPAPVSSLENVIAVSCGLTHTAAITSGGTVWVWGNNDDGRLGDAAITNMTDVIPIQTLPAPLAGLTGLTAADFTPADPSKAPLVSAMGNFSDVKEGEYYAGPVQWALARGITSGTSPTTFSPDATCDNGQIITFLWRAYGAPEPEIQNPFTNVKSSDYYYKAVLWAYEKGIVSGKTFAASHDCTRASAVMYIWRAAGSPHEALHPFFYDIPEGEIWDGVAWAVAQGITSGTGEHTFSPDSVCTRGQIVTFLYRALGQ